MAEDLRARLMDEDGRASDELTALVAELTGREVTDLRLVRHGTNHVFSAPAAGVVARVAAVAGADGEASDHDDDDNTAEVDIHRNLGLVAEVADRGAPVVPPLSLSIAAGPGYLVTAWPLCRELDGQPERAMGLTLAALHGVEAGSLDLQPVDVSRRFAQRLRAVAGALPDDLFLLLEERSRIAAQVLAELTASAPPVLLHGDAHPGNLMVHEGAAAFVDLDDLCVGPREFDLTPAMVSYTRFHRDRARWEAFCAGYGCDPDDALAELEPLRVVRESTMNTWLATLWPSSARARDELRRRLGSWDEDWRTHAAWEAM